jgi:hypothetical protein
VLTKLRRAKCGACHASGVVEWNRMDVSGIVTVAADMPEGRLRRGHRGEKIKERVL